MLILKDYEAVEDEVSNKVMSSLEEKHNTEMKVVPYYNAHVYVQKKEGKGKLLPQKWRGLQMKGKSGKVKW